MSWSEIASIRSMKIFTGSGSKNTSLYANGKHRVEVVASIIAYDKNNQVVNLTQTEMYENINLVNFQNEDLTSPFKLSSSPGDFGESVRFEGMNDNITNELDTNASTYRWYISIDTKKYDSYKIAIRCYAAGSEYTTAPENNNQNATVDFITVNILNQKTFNTSDLAITKMPVRNYKTTALSEGILYESEVEVFNKYIKLADTNGSIFKKIDNVKDNIIAREDQQPVIIYWAVNVIAINSSSVLKESNKKINIYLDQYTNRAKADIFVEGVITNEFDGISIIEIPQLPYQMNNEIRNPIPLPQEFIAYDQFGNSINILCRTKDGSNFLIEYVIR